MLQSTIVLKTSLPFGIKISFDVIQRKCRSRINSSFHEKGGFLLGGREAFRCFSTIGTRGNKEFWGSLLRKARINGIL